MIEPGIYFGLSKEDYDADTDYVRSSDFKNLKKSPLSATYKEDKGPTEALKIGDARHLLYLEGWDAFSKHYVIKPAVPEGALVSMAELRKHCEKLEIGAGRSLASAVEAIREVDSETVLWPEIEAEHKATLGDRIEISAEAGAKMLKSKELICGHPHVSQFFREGAPEVSIFWHDEKYNLRKKARIDRLRHNDWFLELKTFSNSTDRDVAHMFPWIIANRDYHLSAAMYSDGIENAKKFEHDQFHDAPGHFDIGAFKKSKQHRCVFVFAGTDVPHVRARVLEPTINGESSVIWDKGADMYHQLTRYYAMCVQKYGRDEPWWDDEPITYLENRDFPLWAVA